MIEEIEKRRKEQNELEKNAAFEIRQKDLDTEVKIFLDQIFLKIFLKDLVVEEAEISSQEQIEVAKISQNQVIEVEKKLTETRLI